MISIIFGKPGAGKSTTFAFTVQQNERKRAKYQKRINKSKLYKKLSKNEDKKLNQLLLRLFYSKPYYDVIYCTDETIQDTVYIDYADIGFWKPTWNSLLLFEEAGIGFDNRQYKTLKKEAKRLFAMHRHSGCDILCVSQTVDIDKALRNRAEVMFLASKLGPFTMLRKILYDINVNEETHTLEEGYYKIKPIVYIWQLLTCKRRKHKKKKLLFTRSMFIYRPFYYKYFDSFVDDFDYPMLAPDVAALEKEKEKEIINLEGELCYE